MKSQTKLITLLLALLVATHITTGLSSKPHEDQPSHSHPQQQHSESRPSSKERETSSRFLDYWKKHEKTNQQGHGKELATKHKEDHYYNYYRDGGRRMTCDKFPRVCHVKGSPGPDCCKKKCVDVRHDQLNCGMCGNKCKYPEVCCKGRCVNMLRDRKNCGRCGNKCRRGSFCEYGMCSYA